jgi:hypothetical protein
MLSVSESFVNCQVPRLVFVLVFLFYVDNRTSPAFLLRAGGQFLAKSSAGVVFVFCCVWFYELFCPLANLPINEGFCRSLSHDG